jgi:hypothetical protein
MRASVAGVLGAAVASLLACTPNSPSTDASDSSEAGTSSSTGSGEESTGDGDGESDETGTEPDLPVPECDILKQDCPAGEKCVPNGSLTRCVPADPDGQTKGEPCERQGTNDDCGPGLVCWTDEPGSGPGTCEEMCSGEFDSPTCPDDADWCASYRRGFEWFPLCRPKCHPMMDACEPGAVCEQSTYLPWFVCSVQGMPLISGSAEKCDLDGEPRPMCDVGFHCENGPFNCQEGCCYELCDLDAVDTCDFGACQALLTTPPGLESVGVCKN